jgi:hypothetical protein
VKAIQERVQDCGVEGCQSPAVDVRSEALGSSSTWKRGEQVPNENEARHNPERLSWSAEGAALRWREKHPDEDAPPAAAPDVPEDDHIVPNRHSASAEAAALRWSEEHGNDED